MAALSDNCCIAQSCAPTKQSLSHGPLIRIQLLVLHIRLQVTALTRTYHAVAAHKCLSYNIRRDYCVPDSHAIVSWLALQVTALTRTGQPLLVDAACPADSTSADGAIAVPPAPAKLSCSFTIQGMPPTPGAVSALVRIAGAAAPLPVQPAEYAVTPGSSTTGSSKDANQSSCLKVGPLRNQLVKASKGAGESATAAAVKGMPVLDVASNFPVGSVCDSLEKTGYTLTFGLFGAKDCGVYAFQSEWQVTGAGSAAAAQPLLLERPDINFAVEVVGCVAGE